jgi:predicted GNAT superfamily acetyltransferase
VPHDVDRLRRSDPALAVAWRQGVREALMDALAAGYAVTDMTADGFYVLRLP